MSIPKSDITEAHQHCIRNQSEIQESQKCGCFYCCEEFDSNDVVDFLESEGTALCPNCGTDSVIGDASGFKITKEFLSEMRRHWFW